jgi:hypothetical protein
VMLLDVLPLLVLQLVPSLLLPVTACMLVTQ